MARRPHASGVVGLTCVIIGLLAALGGVVASVTDVASSGSAAIRSAEVPSAATASIGDLVFEDRDDDGRRDPTEPGVAGVEVSLLDPAGGPVLSGAGTPVSPKITDAAGHYEFTGLRPGAYRVAFADVPAGARFSESGHEADVDDDSDADPATGTTQVVSLAAGERDLTIDAGVFIATPAVAIETRAQGLDADLAPGPTVPEGTDVSLDYLVVNTGNERLANLVVTDDGGVTVTCERTTVAVGQTVRCSGTSTETAGTHRNVGTVTAAGADSGLVVSAADPAHHTGGARGLLVSKQVGAAEADVATAALEVLAGSPVTYTFTVANTGDEGVVGIGLEDVGGGAVACPASELGPGQTMECEPRTLSAPTGLGTNVAIVRGQGAVSATPLAATDAANVFGRDPRLVLSKEAYDPARRAYLDADADPGSPGSNDGVVALVEPGSTARYRLQLTNAGNVDLPSAAVVDPACDEAPALVLGDHGAPGTLDVGESWTLRCERDDVAAAYTNTADATAGDVTARERARVETIGGDAAVAIEKLVRGPGSTTFAPTADVATGDAATFRIRITNTGARPLVDIVVRDARVPGCDHEVAGPLAPGASTTAVLCSSAPLSAAMTNEATVAASPLGAAALVTDVASASVRVVGPRPPDLALTKAVLERSGDEVLWTLTVRNLGPGRAEGPVRILDDLPAGLAYAGAAGDRWRCTAIGQAVRCDGPALDEGASSTVVLSTRVAPGTSGSVRNTARLARADGNPANDASTAVLGSGTTTSSTTTPTTTTTSTTPGGGTGDRPSGAAGTPGIPDGRLPLTGVDVRGLWLTGLSLVALGLLLAWSGRRRRRDEAPS